MKKQVLGRVESIKIKDKKIKAKIDTGAEKSSIDLNLAKKLGLTKNLWGIKKIKSSNGEEYRPIVESKIKIKNRKLPVKLSITKRENLKYPILIGRDVLKRNFLVDISKCH